jgi:hypothetical protein
MGHLEKFSEKATAKLVTFFELTKFNLPKSRKSAVFEYFMAPDCRIMSKLAACMRN